MVHKHGEFVAPEIALIQDPSPKPVNPDAVNGVLARFSKTARASDEPSALGNVSAVYPSAICVTSAGGSAQMRGLGLIAVLVYIGACSFIFPSIGFDIYRAGINDQSFFGDIVVGGFLFFFLFVVARPWIVAAWRMDMFGADDEPTILDRQRKKVYRLFLPLDNSHRTWAQRFKPIPLEAAEYDWSGISAEHRVELVTSGKTVSRTHKLVFVARDHLKPGESYGRLLEEIIIGNPVGLGPNTVPMLWEHLRRYMEQGGPSVPKGEPMQVFERPTTLWQSLGVVGPFGPRFLWWWKTSRFIVLFFLVALPFTLPYSILWGVCNWISHKTMRQTVWPAELVALLGEPLHPSTSPDSSFARQSRPDT